MSARFYDVTTDQLHQWDKSPYCRFSLDGLDVWDGLFVIAHVYITFDGGTGYVHIEPLAHLDYDLALDELERLEGEELQRILLHGCHVVAEYEIWHIVSKQDLLDHTPVFPPLSGVSYVADYDGQSTLIMHFVPALSAHVAVLVDSYDVYLPTDWQCLQPFSLADVNCYDWLPCGEFVGEFGAWDYVRIMDAISTFNGLGVKAC